MIALEFRDPVEVSTPKGDGLIWYMMDYGPNSDTLYTIIMKESGECWQMTHKDFRIKANTTMGIGGGYKEDAKNGMNGSRPASHERNPNPFSKNPMAGNND